jgi:zinc protease
VKRRTVRLGIVLPALLLLAAAPASAQPIPDHPSKLHFDPIAFEPPVAAQYQHQLKNGMVVFFAEDRTLPLVNISLLMRVGSYLEPAGKEGLAGMVGSQMRRGGTRELGADELDEQLDFLAAQVATGIGDTSGSAHLNCLADNLDQSLRLFVQVLREPRFQEDRLELAKRQTLQQLEKRNDDSADIEAYEWGALLYGEQHLTNRFVTGASLQSLTREDLVAFHRQWVHPARMVAAVSGAITLEEALQKLEVAFADWPTPAPEVPPVPGDIHPAAPGLYRIDKDVNQGRVSIGLPTVTRDSPDVYALEVMNEILGGGGFTSRITRTVRSNEGLAYSAGSGLSVGIYYPGRFRAAFQSKSATVAYATELVLDEIRKMREGPVTDDELETVKRSLVETFPSSFASKAQSMAIFAGDELTGRDPSYWTRYRDRIRAVTAADVQRVARQYLVPEKMILLVVGNLAEIDKGDGQHAVTLAELAGGRVTDLPLRDPLTMKRPDAAVSGSPRASSGRSRPGRVRR